MNASLQLYNEHILQFINADFEITTLANDCLFTEGPVWNKEGFYLFSDTQANTVYKIEEGKNKEVFIANSGIASAPPEDLNPNQAGSNALAYDADGTLLVCRHGSHDIAKWNGKELTSYINSYKGKPLNSPNDLVVDEKGNVFFSDPPYGLKDGKANPEKYQPVAAVYCFHNGELTLVCDKYQYPNGVCLPPNNNELYICSNKPFEKFISVYDKDTLHFKRTLAEENSDGIKCDPQGNVWLCSKEGLIILNSYGHRLALIKLPTIPANICFGGADKKDAFITARENIFLIKNLLR